MIAFRTWGKLLLAALGAGLLAGAGQLGLAYGLALVRFARSFDGTTRNQWAAQLSWVGWFAMVAAVGGALIGQRLARRAALPSTTGSRICLAAAAGLGAAMVAPLCMQPARAAQVASTSPVAATGLVALLGAVIGVVVAVAVLTWRPVAWNVAAMVGAVWLLALISVMPSLGPEDPLPAVRLGVLDLAWLSADTAQWLAVLMMPVVALAAGAGAAGLARWRGQPTVDIATAGLAGPALLAAAYLLAGPGTGDRYQTAPYWGSLVGLGAGGLASVVVAVLRWPLGGPAGVKDDTDPADASAAIVPTDILRPIPGDRLSADGTHRPRHAGRDDDPAAPVTVGGSPLAASTTTLPPTGSDGAEPVPSFHSQVIPAHQVPSWGTPFPSPPRTEDFWPDGSVQSAAGTRSTPASAPAPKTRRAARRAGGRPGSASSPAVEAVPAAEEDGSVERPTGTGGRPTTGTGARPSADAIAWTKPADESVPSSAATDATSPEPPTAAIPEPAGTTRKPEAESRAGTGPAADGESSTGAATSDADERTPAIDQAAGRGRRGLFGRNRSGAPVGPAPDPAGDGDPAAEPTARPPAGPAPTGRTARGRGPGRKGVPARDEEYVDWVSGLADDPVDDRPTDPGPLRTLRSSGRHHVD